VDFAVDERLGDVETASVETHDGLKLAAWRCPAKPAARGHQIQSRAASKSPRGSGPSRHVPETR
jgi:hypothetical protein